MNPPRFFPAHCQPPVRILRMHIIVVLPPPAPQYPALPGLHPPMLSCCVPPLLLRLHHQEWRVGRNTPSATWLAPFAHPIELNHSPRFPSLVPPLVLPSLPTTTTSGISSIDRPLSPAPPPSKKHFERSHTRKQWPRCRDSLCRHHLQHEPVRRVGRIAHFPFGKDPHGCF
jgi:hypothetical protein